MARTCKYYNGCDYRKDVGECPVRCVQYKHRDAVIVVRCKDCIHWEKGDSKGGNSIEDLQWIGGCKWAKCCRREMDFCSMGERKDND